MPVAAVNLPPQPPDFPRVWETFAIRYTFIADHLAFQLGDRQAVRSDSVNAVGASLIYVDLVSVLDRGLELALQGQGSSAAGSLARRIEALEAQGRLNDAQALHRIRNRRNKIAHGLVQVSPVELELAVSTVEAELQHLALIGSPKRYVAFLSTSEWREYSGSNRLRYERDFEFGVQEAKTAEPVLVVNFLERVDSIQNPTIRERLESKLKM